MTDWICRVCAVEHKIERRKSHMEMGFCPVCEEYHALFEVVEIPIEEESDDHRTGSKLT